ncbi:T9SS type A sorting domain-containing protein [Lewinella sp. LCG006]|uniref:DUF7619 domain-containing protein n=1 Tax=Lewinella sp. LCG006 TaxID=3231911 RepID=UPI00345FF5FE
MNHRKLLIWAVLLLFVLPLTGQINISISNDVTICEGESVFLDANPSGGDGNYTYSWTPTEGLSCADCLGTMATPTVTTTYTLTVEDGLGEQGSASVTVTVAPLVIEATVQNINCNGANTGFIQINNGANFIYEWSNGDTNPLQQGLSAGTYCVTVTNGSGCANEECFVITEPPVLQADASATNVTCAGMVDGTITVTVIGGVAPYIYNWDIGLDGSTLVNLPAGTYSVTIIDASGCTVVTDATILEDPSFTVTVNGLPTEPCVTDFTLQAVTEGGSGNFTYLWEINGVVASTTTELVNPAPGQIVLTVTNENGCSITQFVSYDPFPLVDVNTSGILSCSTGSVVLDGSGSTSGPDYTYQWTGPNGFSSDQEVVTVSDPGIYVLTVSSISVAGCSSSLEVTVTDLTLDFEDGIITTVLGCNDYRLQGIIPANYFGQIAFEWTFPDGVTTITDEQTITPTQTGIYTLRTEAIGFDCNFYSTIFIDLEAETCATINGYVHQDDNEDCAPDPADLPLEGWEVIATDGVASYVAFTDSEGYYELSVPIATTSVTLIAPSAAWEICLATVELDPALEEGEARNVDFPVKALVYCPELNVNLSANFLRRCFSNYYYINVTNNGTETAFGAEVILTLDEFVFYENSSLQPTGIVDQTIVWTIDEIAPNETVFFWVQVFVSCNAQLGQTHCSEVFVTPNPLCAPAQNWSGTNLELEADCNGTDVVFTVRNTGTEDLAESINYIVIEDGVAMMQPQMIDDLGGDQIETFLFPANGSTYTFQIDQVENHPYSEVLSLSIEGCGLNDQNEFSTGFVTQFSQTTATISSDVFCLENVGSYDPNDKAALPVGYGEQHYIVPETELYYRIRFQNTGTDTAFTVVIRDTLSEYLDLRTIDLGVSTHDYTANIGADRALTFTFNNILLPDSTTNLEASQGFVDFRISPDANAPLETIIENDAAIYFDFNEPVITNTVFHTLGRNFLEVVNTEVVPGVAIQWNIFPNPVADQLELQLSGEEVPDRLLLQVLDAQGRLLRQASFSGKTHSLSVADLPAGWYQLRLTLDNGDLLGTAKLVKK